METNTLSNATIAEVVANDYRTAVIFKKYADDVIAGDLKNRVCPEYSIKFRKISIRRNKRYN